MRDNNYGFTLVELIAAIVLLALVAGIGTYSITSIIKRSKEENYNLLIKNIESAASVYYQECRYNHENSDVIICNTYDGGYITSLGQLVSYGYLEGNEKIKDGEDKGKYTIVNPLNDDNIGSCRIIVKYDEENQKLLVYDVDGDKCLNYGSGEKEAVNDYYEKENNSSLNDDKYDTELGNNYEEKIDAELDNEREKENNSSLGDGKNDTDLDEEIFYAG